MCKVVTFCDVFPSTLLKSNNVISQKKKKQIALALRACVILLSLKNQFVLIYTKLHAKSCYYLHLNSQLLKFSKVKPQHLFTHQFLQLVFPSFASLSQRSRSTCCYTGCCRRSTGCGSSSAPYMEVARYDPGMKTTPKFRRLDVRLSVSTETTL